MDSNQSHPVVPWWRVRMVWVVIAGPLSVVLAGFVTAALAVYGADTVVREAARPATASQAPAIQARNHAAAPAR